MLDSMRLVCLLSAALGLAGCRSSPEPQPPPTREVSLLRGQIEFFVDAESAQLEDLSARLGSAADTPGRRRVAQLWKMAVIPELRASLDRADDEAVLLHLWARNAQMRHYFAQGPGSVRFGEDAVLGVEVFAALSESLAALAEQELGPERFPAAKELIERYGQGHPLEVDPMAAAEHDSELAGLLRDSLGKPLDVVMQPLRAINPGKGLDETARAVKEFSFTVETARRDLKRLPEQIRWQTELLMLDLDDNASRQAAQASLSALSATAEELGRTAQGLPAEVEQRVTALLAELDARQGELRATLDSARQTLGEGEKVVVAGEATARALTGTAQAIDAVLLTLMRLNAELAGPPPPPDAPPPPPGEPFDIQDYTRTAEALTDSLRQLNTALEQVRELSAPESSERLAALVDESVAAATRRVALAAAGVVLLAAVAYALARRWSAR